MYSHDLCMHAHTEAHMYTLIPEVYMHTWCAYRQLNVQCLIDAREYVQSEVFIHLAACKPRQEQWAVFHFAPG